MIEFIVLVLTISLFLYSFLAGADFGAGILQLLPIGVPREKKSQIIGKAMGPVWEANHIWLILALVITFNAFPTLFWFLCEYFHFPLGALIIGIIFRGASFTFLHYDPIRDRSEIVYHWIFGLSSLWCTLWLGIIIGSLMLGDFSLQNVDIYSRYFAHWLNPFCLLMGVFITVLMMFNASLFLYLEALEDRERWLRITLRVLSTLVLSGALVHLTFYLTAAQRWRLFFYNPLSLGLITASFFLLFLQHQLIKFGYKRFSRALAGVQLMAVITAGFAPLYPKVVLFKDGQYLDFYEMAAGPAVLRYLCWALAIGCVLILPSYFYLLKIFKGQQQRPSREVI